MISPSDLHVTVTIVIHGKDSLYRYNLHRTGVLDVVQGAASHAAFIRWCHGQSDSVIVVSPALSVIEFGP